MKQYSILAVDSEVCNLNALKRTFRREYGFFSTVNREDALAVMEDRHIDIVIAYDLLSGMTGVELMEEITQKHPDTVRIIFAAYFDKGFTDAINMGYIHRYILMPWSPDEVKAIVRQEIEAHEITRATREIYTKLLVERGIISREQLESALHIQRTSNKKIGRILIEYGMISEDQLSEALRLQESDQKRLGEILVGLGTISPNDVNLALDLQKHGRRLPEILLDLGYSDEESIIHCFALRLGMPYISLPQIPMKPKLARLLPSELAYKHTIAPVSVMGKVLTVAVSEPLSDRARSEIEDETGCKVMTICATHRDIKAAMAQCYASKQKLERDLFPVLNRK